jgi:hypothetical protein
MFKKEDIKIDCMKDPIGLNTSYKARVIFSQIIEIDDNANAQYEFHNESKEVIQTTLYVNLFNAVYGEHNGVLTDTIESLTHFKTILLQNWYKPTDPYEECEDLIKVQETLNNIQKLIKPRY